MGRDGKRFTIRVGRRAPQRATSVRSQRAKRASLRPAGSAPGTPNTARGDPSDTPMRSSTSGPAAELVQEQPPVAQPTSAPIAPTPIALAPSAAVAMAPQRKKKGLFKRLADHFRSGPAPPTPPAAPRRSEAQEARNAALRARGLLPPQDMSALEAAQDARLDQERRVALAPPSESSAPDEGPSAAKEIMEQWKRQHSMDVPRKDEADVQPEFTLAPLPPPPRRLSQASSQLSSSPPALPSPPASATFGTFDQDLLSTHSNDPVSTTASNPRTPTKVGFALDQSPRTSAPSTPRRAGPPPPIVLTPSKRSFLFDDEDVRPENFPLPPSPSPSAGSGTFGPSLLAPQSPRLLSPSVQPISSRTRSNTSGTDATVPSLSSCGETSEDSAAPATPSTSTGAPEPSLGCDVIIEEPLELGQDDLGALPPPSPSAKAKRSSTLPPASRRKSLLLTGLKRGLTARRAPKSPTSPKAAAVEASLLRRGPSTRLANTALHDRGTIADQTSAIKDDEERRLAEMAFLDF